MLGPYLTGRRLARPSTCIDGMRTRRVRIVTWVASCIIAASVALTSCSLRSCSEGPQPEVGHEFYGILSEVVLRVTVTGDGRSVEAHRRSVKVPFEYELKTAGRTVKCPATRAFNVALEQAYSVMVRGTLSQSELEQLERAPRTEMLELRVVDVIKGTTPFELRLQAPAKPPRPTEVPAYLPGENIGFITDSRVVALFDIDCSRMR